MYRAYERSLGKIESSLDSIYSCPYGIDWHQMALSENDLQRAIITWAKTQVGKHPELLWLHHVPNGGKRDSREAMLLKSSGVTPGILDLHLPVPSGDYNGLMIELKEPGGKCKAASKEQSEYIEFLTSHGYATLLSNSFEEVKGFILDYLEGRIKRWH
jgi:hypothetical protein